MGFFSQPATSPLLTCILMTSRVMWLTFPFLGIFQMIPVDTDDDEVSICLGHFITITLSVSELVLCHDIWSDGLECVVIPQVKWFTTWCSSQVRSRYGGWLWSVLTTKWPLCGWPQVVRVGSCYLACWKLSLISPLVTSRRFKHPILPLLGYLALVSSAFMICYLISKVRDTRK